MQALIGKSDELIYVGRALKQFPHALHPAKLEKINLCNNELSVIPGSNLAFYVNLTVLVLSGNRIQSIPKEVGNLIRLRVLRVDKNCLSNLPEELCTTSFSFTTLTP